MQPIYDKLAEDGKIEPKFKGPDGKLKWKEHTEYPKQVTTASGARVRVTSLVEEMSVANDKTPVKGAKPDPLAKEKLALAEQAAALAKQKKDLEDQAAKMAQTLAEVQAERKAVSDAKVAPQPISLAPTQTASVVERT